MATTCDQPVSTDVTNGKISLKNLVNVKDINEVDFDKLELLRGETPDDIRDQCLKLCQQYLAGNWLQQSTDTIKVVRVSGGMTNQLYYCGIVDKSDDNQEVPQQVAVRLYGPKYFNNKDCDGNERLTDVVIALMVSQNKLGPKIYGIFDGGQIQAFYKHRQFKVEEQKDPKLVTELFQKLARVHGLNVPIKKCHWSLKEMDRFYNNFINKTDLKCLVDKFDVFIENDFKTEIDWLKGLIEKTNSPLVFTHNDFRSSNIMVLEDKNVESGEQIVLCDFEYSSYGYRGQDFAIILTEWGRTMNDMKKPMTLPDDSTLRSIFDIYIKETERLFGKDYCEANRFTSDVIIKEAKIFALYMQIWFVVFMLGNEEESSELFSNKDFILQFSEIGYKNYFHLKQQLKDQNLF
ncbi:choline/ethanolamine kinase-like [Oppia nitens]|uniref:choline/ethanolamine kinase-like n=1 Tax=Oppia nitens TaxID=1686743 RepID=UPI0023D99C9A|nr:choline/ethanolamine kinase-like [Oppia nitens]